MTQPALSNSLARLRDVLGDQLFIRGQNGMRPTPRALELAVPVGQALRQLQAAFEQRKFVPSEAEWTYRISMTPHASTVLLPALLERVHAAAPRVQIRIVPKDNRTIWTMLDANEVDFVVGVLPDIPKRLKAIDLYEDSFVAVMRRGHPLSRRTISLTTFAGADQVLITATGGDSSLFEEELKLSGYRRRIRLIVNEYLAGLMVIDRTDLITGLFGRIFDLVSGFEPLDLISKPLPMNRMPVKLAWHPGLSNHPAYDWLREQLVAVSKSVQLK
jgi:DNA-binding transcriptional LysR family regulator